MKKVYAIIVTYNSMKWIEGCLQSLRSSTAGMGVVVVDNCSTDGTREYVPEHFPEVVWLPQERNLGFGQGNNLGMRYALEHDADYVLLLNQDAYLQKDALELMLRVADGRNLVTPLHLNGTGTMIDANFRESLKRADCTMLDDLLLQRDLKESYEIGESCAACWLMPVSMLREIGGFNPLFFQYGEDNNYFTRMLYHGRRNYVVPAARVWHDRTVHGNEKAFNSRRVARRILVVACSPNLSLASKCNRIFDSFLMSPVQTLVEMLRLLPRMPKIMASLKKEKRIGRTWL